MIEVIKIMRYDTAQKEVYGKPMLVKETNPRFEWYKKNSYFKVLQKFQVEEKIRPKRKFKKQPCSSTPTGGK